MSFKIVKQNFDNKEDCSSDIKKKLKEKNISISTVAFGFHRLVGHQHTRQSKLYLPHWLQYRRYGTHWDAKHDKDS